MAKTKIQVNPDGTVKILDVCGLGQNCLEATKSIEAAFGKAEETSRVLTEEFYAGEEQRIELENDGA